MFFATALKESDDPALVRFSIDFVFFYWFFMDFPLTTEQL